MIGREPNGLLGARWKRKGKPLLVNPAWRLYRHQPSAEVDMRYVGQGHEICRRFYRTLTGGNHSSTCKAAFDKVCIRRPRMAVPLVPLKLLTGGRCRPTLPLMWRLQIEASD
ncbi:MAG: hypothetical protein H6668_06120 [Ardenticatenaceae bacterium]|nr:hypothetical protein [Ardenticatenaceae bacterium]